MGIIGNNTGGSSLFNLGADEKIAAKYVASESFTATRMGVEMASQFDSGEKVRLGIYDASYLLLGYTNEITGHSANFPERVWYHAELTESISISNGNTYWLAVIADSACDISFTTETLTSKYDADDTYSDGFEDPFGSSVNDDYKISIYAADSDDYFVTSGTDDALGRGGWVGETSGGTKYSVTLRDMSYGIRIYKNIDTLPAPVAGPNVSTITGGGSIGHIDAVIDSNNKIHCICVSTAEPTRPVSYRVFDTGTDTWDGSGWELVSEYTQQVPSNVGVAISIDSNDKPHVLFVDNVKVGGSNQDNVYYTERTGGSWATPTQIGERDVKTYYYHSPELTLRNSDYINVQHYGNDTGHAVFWRVYTGSWGDPLRNSETAIPTIGSVISTTAGIVRYYYTQNDDDIYETTTDIQYNTHSTNEKVSAALDGTDRYIFYIDTGEDVHLVSNDGGGWTDEGDLQTGAYDHVIAGWSYNALNNTTSIDYLYDDGTTIYWDEYSLAVAAGAPPPRIRPMRFWRGVR
jgi:hypothetical protein